MVDNKENDKFDLGVKGLIRYLFFSSNKRERFQLKGPLNLVGLTLRYHPLNRTILKGTYYLRDIIISHYLQYSFHNRPFSGSDLLTKQSFQKHEFESAKYFKPNQTSKLNKYT